LLDDGTGKVQELMRELHEKASAEIEKQEKLRKRRMAITEASKGNAEGGTNNPNPEGLNEQSANELQVDEEHHEDPQPSGQVPVEHEQTSSAPRDTAQKSAMAKSHHSQKPMQQQTYQPQSMIVNSAAPALPNVVLDDFVYRLTDLINSDFKMPETDKDYELSHAQLIKICKILLYKLNLVSKKNAYEREELANMINDRVTSIENLTKSSLEEVNTFLHTVHQDFEHFLTKHKREHTDLNIKMARMQEELSQSTSGLETTKRYVENYATILSCVVEFCSIEQVLSLADEDDRQQIQLSGRNKVSKQPEEPYGINQV
jgi:DNA-binding transcriptional regulator YiaG